MFKKMAVNELSHVKNSVTKCVLQQPEPGKIGVPQEFADIAYAELETDSCPLCEAGIQLVDTPGLHGSAEVEKITRDYLKSGRYPLDGC